MLVNAMLNLQHFSSDISISNNSVRMFIVSK